MIAENIISKITDDKKDLNQIHLNLSNFGLAKLNVDEENTFVESIDLKSNFLEEFEYFQFFCNLWWIDLSFNQIKSLSSFSHLHSLGLLNLTHNLLKWEDLTHLANLHIIDLRLYGNFQLENDPNYRLHVVDCLPNLWMLDGKLISSTERQQIHNFFQDSALSPNPIRHYTNKNHLRKHISGTHIHGYHAERLSNKFAVNEIQTAGTDIRRLKYLAENLYLRLKAIGGDEKARIDSAYFCKLLDYRNLYKEKSSILLLLLVSSIEFNLPKQLLHQTLETCELNFKSNLDVGELFNLNKKMKIEIMCLLVSAAKLERDLFQGVRGKYSEDGLYDRLYLALYHSIDRFLRFKNKPKIRKKSGGKLSNSMYKLRTYASFMTYQRSTWISHRNLLAAEIVLLFSVIPTFYDFIIDGNSHVCNLIIVATNDQEICERITKISSQVDLPQVTAQDLYEEVNKAIRHHIATSVNNTIKLEQFQDHIPNKAVVHGTVSLNTRNARFILAASNAYQKRPESSILASGERLLYERGVIKRSFNSASQLSNRQRKRVKIGDLILFDNNLGKVLAVPDKVNALVEMKYPVDTFGNVTLGKSDSRNYYSYVHVALLEYNHHKCCWQTIKSTSELLNEETREDFKKPEDSFLRTNSLASTEDSLSSKLSGNDDSGEMKSSTFKPIEMLLSSYFCKKMNLSLPKSWENRNTNSAHLIKKSVSSIKQEDENIKTNQVMIKRLDEEKSSLNQVVNVMLPTIDKKDVSTKEECLDNRRSRSAVITRPTPNLSSDERPTSVRVKEITPFENKDEDDIEIVSSFQLLRTEAWRSSTSSSFFNPNEEPQVSTTQAVSSSNEDFNIMNEQEENLKVKKIKSSIKISNLKDLNTLQKSTTPKPTTFVINNSRLTTINHKTTSPIKDGRKSRIFSKNNLQIKCKDSDLSLHSIQGTNCFSTPVKRSNSAMIRNNSNKESHNWSDMLLASTIQPPTTFNNQSILKVSSSKQHQRIWPRHHLPSYLINFNPKSNLPRNLPNQSSHGT